MGVRAMMVGQAEAQAYLKWCAGIAVWVSQGVQ